MKEATDSVPLVSIVTPIYNGAAFLPQTATDVCGQSFRKWEWLIVDDGSRDDSHELARTIASQDDRVRVWRRSENSGLPAVPRNEALEHARGRFIAFLDADDRWHPQKLACQLGHIRQTGCAWQFSNSLFLGGPLPRRRKFPPGWHPSVPFWPNALRGDGVPFLTVMASRAILEASSRDGDIGTTFDTSDALRGVEDWDLVLRLGMQVEPGYVARVLAGYRVHDGGLSRDPGLAFRAALALIEKHRRLGAEALVCHEASRHRESKRAATGVLRGESGARGRLLRSIKVRGGVLPSLRECWLACMVFLPPSLAKQWYRVGLRVQQHLSDG